jgi:hypothetical protein
MVKTAAASTICATTGESACRLEEISMTNQHLDNYSFKQNGV